MQTSFQAKTTWFAMLVTATALVNAHMQMENPPPLRSQFNKFYDYTNIDYSMTSPLTADGSNYPAKGYASDVPSVSQAVDTLTAGQQYKITLAGTATHTGGSCQVSMSYDDGKSFGVIHSVIGGCPLSKEISFTVPYDLPAGDNVLLSWSWFNREGNREMYQNAAAVNVTSSATGSLTLPAMFTANVYGEGSCNTVEGDEIVFPNPGDSVEYGGIWADRTPSSGDFQISSGCSDTVTEANKSGTVKLSANGNVSSESDDAEGDDETSTSAAPGTESGSKSSDSSVPVSSDGLDIATSTAGLSGVTVTISQSSNESGTISTSTQTKTQQVPSTSAGNASSVPSTTTETTATATATIDSCTEGSVVCSDDGGSFSVCSSGALVAMGDVASGTVCVDGQISLAATSSSSVPSNITVGSATACTPNSLKCSADGQTFSVCDGTGSSYTDMGSVAPGTICQEGSIVLSASARRLKRAAGHAKRAMIHVIS